MNVGSLTMKLGFKLENFAAVGKFDSATKAAASSIKGGSTNLGKADAAFKGFGRTLGSLLNPMSLVRLQSIVMGSALVALAKKASDVGANLTKFRNLTGLSTDKLQEWQQQAAMSGVEADELAASIENIQQTGAEMKIGKMERVGPWAFLGIDPRQDPFVVLNQLQTKLKQMSPAMGSMFARDIGLSDSMINFLKEAKSLPESNRGLLLSGKEVDRLKSFNILFNQTWDNTKRTFTKIGVALIPVARGILWAAERMNKAFVTVMKTVEKFGTKIFDIMPALLVLGGILLAVFSPFLFTMVAIALAFEDVMTWVQGGKSVTGDIVGPYIEWRDTLKDIHQWLTWISEKIKEIVEFGKWVFQYSQESEGVDWEKDAKDKAAARSNLWESIKKAAYSLGSGGMMGGGTPVPASFLAPGPLNTPAGGPTITNTFNIDGAQDPRAVAAEVMDAMKMSYGLANPVLLRGIHDTMPMQEGT